MTVVVSGSSPLTRGKPVKAMSAFLAKGLIPAHAGKTRRDAGLAGSSWAHPRSRGENQAGRRSSRLQLGSSPLTRGKRALWLGLHLLCRLIPAHAGKTHDHP